MIYLKLLWGLNLFVVLLAFSQVMLFRGKYLKAMDPNNNRKINWFSDVTKARIYYYRSWKVFIVILIIELVSSYLLYKGFSSIFDKFII